MMLRKAVLGSVGFTTEILVKSDGIETEMNPQPPDPIGAHAAYLKTLTQGSAASHLAATENVVPVLVSSEYDAVAGPPA